MKKVLLITSEYGETGGGLSFACKRFHSLLEEEFHFKVILVSSVEKKILTVEGGYKENLVHSIENEYRIKSDYNKYKEENIDFVIAFGGGFNGYYASILAKLLSTKYILMLRGSDINLCKWSSDDCFCMTYALENAHHIVCLSEEMKTNISLFSGKLLDKVHIIPNIIEHCKQRVYLKAPNNGVTIGTAASHINEKKGIANMLSMIAEFKKLSSYPIHFEVVGSIDNDIKEKYLDIARRLNISENIKWINYVSREVYHELVNKWDFYIQGSVCEGFGNSVTEAIREGKAVILSPTGYIAEQLKARFPLLVFDTWNPQNMAKQLLNIIIDEKREIVYDQAYSFLAQTASKERVVDLWKEIFIESPQRGIRRYNMLPNDNILSVTLHDVSGFEHDNITTPVPVFKQFVKDIYMNGYGLCSMKDFLQKTDPARWIVCTFDDGYSSLIENALPVLKEYDFTATVFVCTSLIGKSNNWNNKDTKVRNHLTWEELDNLNANGWEIASHGVTHRCLLRLTDPELESELKNSKDTLQKKYGQVISYAYPYGISNEFIQKYAGTYYEYIFSLSQGGTHLECDRLQIKRYFISEIYKILQL